VIGAVAGLTMSALSWRRMDGREFSRRVWLQLAGGLFECAAEEPVPETGNDKPERLLSDVKDQRDRCLICTFRF
jgi:hypothetical protein